MKKTIALIYALALPVTAVVLPDALPSQPSRTADLEQRSSNDCEQSLSIPAGGCDDSIKLVSNPSTGYTWQILSEGNSDCAKVELEDRAPERQEEAPILCGAPGLTVVKITGLKPGTSRIVLAYCRAWDKNTKPARRVTINVTVVPSK